MKKANTADIQPFGLSVCSVGWPIDNLSRISLSAETEFNLFRLNTTALSIPPAKCLAAVRVGLEVFEPVVDARPDVVYVVLDHAVVPLCCNGEKGASEEKCNSDHFGV